MWQYATLPAVWRCDQAGTGGRRLASSCAKQAVVSQRPTDTSIMTMNMTRVNASIARTSADNMGQNSSRVE
jgi:hypothetical protein